MGEVTSSVDDEELIEHMREVIIPFIREVQITEEVADPSSANSGYGSQEKFVTRFAATMQAATEGLTTEQVGIDKWKCECNKRSRNYTYK